MPEGLNRVYLIGTVGAAPKLVDTRGSKVLLVRLTTTKRIYDRDSGSSSERTEWHDVAIWGKRGEALQEHIRKGTRLFIEGELAYRTREIGGKSVSLVSVRAQKVMFAGGVRGTGRSSGHGQEDR